MRGEVPELKRCCFCLPLRKGLLGWGYVKLALDTLMVLITLYVILCIMETYWMKMELAVNSIPSLIDIAFIILLIVACHKKSAKLLNIYYIYGIVALVVTFGITGFITYIEIHDVVINSEVVPNRSTLLDLMGTLAVYFIQTFIRVYVLLLVRSEVIKLRNQSLEMQFVNNAADGESRCVCTDRGHDTSVQNANNGRNAFVQNVNNRHDSSVKNADRNCGTVEIEINA